MGSAFAPENEGAIVEALQKIAAELKKLNDNFEHGLTVDAGLRFDKKGNLLIDAKVWKQN